MKKLNDSTAAPLRFVTEDGTTLGQFYNSWDQHYHLASYGPYARPPNRYLCGKSGNFSPNRSEGPQRKGPCCPGCAAQLQALSRLEATAFRALGFH